MKAQHDTDPFRGATVEHRSSEMDRAAGIAEEMKKRWHSGTEPDTASVLEKNPELLRYRSLVLDLAHEEYLCRQAAGETLNSDQFVKHFPGMERSLYFLIEVRRMLQQDPSVSISRKDIAWPKPGEEFLGFSLIAELGQGTFGHVFLATEPSLGNRSVALKVAPQGQWEAEILGKLAHPNIVPVYSIQTDSDTGLTAVCMPFLGRVTLLDVIDRAFADSQLPRRGRVFLDILKEINDWKVFPASRDFDFTLARGTYVDAVIHLAAQMADALAFTHAQGVCHRDLKPSNVLLAQNGRPLLLDFNLSGDQEVSALRIGGTLPYMAPEQLRYLLTDYHPDSSASYTSSDIFSLGVILYELLSGSLPFGAPCWKGGVEEVTLNLLARQRKGLQPLRELNKDVDWQLESVVQQCLAYDPRERPSSAESLANSLRRQKRFSRRAKRWTRNHPLRVAEIGVSLLVCALLFGLWLALRDPAEIRLYKQGMLDLQHGNPAQAVEEFNEALRLAPDNMEFLLARAKAYHRQGNYGQAFNEYDHIYSLHPSGDIAALQGHCLSKNKFHQEAIKKYQQALQAGYQPFSVWNNLGFSTLQAVRLSESEEYFKQAISLNPQSSTIWHNMIKLLYKRAGKKDISPQKVIALAKDVAKAADPTPELYADLAALESQMGQQDPSFIPKVFEHLKLAVSLGADPKKILQEPYFSHLQNRKEFSDFLQQKPGTRTSPISDGLINPL
jgi:eukaryotic-like serine/threonine-protein kinase